MKLMAIIIINVIGIIVLKITKKLLTTVLYSSIVFWFVHLLLLYQSTLSDYFVCDEVNNKVSETQYNEINIFIRT